MGMQSAFRMAGGAGGVDDQCRILGRRIEGLELVTVALQLLMVIKHVITMHGCIDNVAQL